MAKAGKLDAGGVPEPTPHAIPAVTEKQKIKAQQQKHDKSTFIAERKRRKKARKA
ncbi:MAG: hypothetical protein ACP5LF_00730 [Nitrososphaeria archaeon]